MENISTPFDLAKFESCTFFYPFLLSSSSSNKHKCPRLVFLLEKNLDRLCLWLLLCSRLLFLSRFEVGFRLCPSLTENQTDDMGYDFMHLHPCDELLVCAVFPGFPTSEQAVPRDF